MNRINPITRQQRDRLLARCQQITEQCDAGRWRRPAGTADTPSEKRFRGVARRLRHWIAGVPQKQIMELWKHATERHIDGITGYNEWIEEMRDCGFDARPNFTTLSPQQKAQRQANLNRMEGRS